MACVCLGRYYIRGVRYGAPPIRGKVPSTRFVADLIGFATSFARDADAGHA